MYSEVQRNMDWWNAWEGGGPLAGIINIPHKHNASDRELNRMRGL